MELRFVKKQVICSVCFLLTVGLIAGFSLNATAAETIKVGLLETFSGPFEFGGRLHAAGVKFAVDEQNAKGGLLGRKIELITEDTEFKPDVATRKAKKLILEDKVNLLCQGFGAPISIALNRVATEYKTLYINYAGAADELQGKEFSRYAFRVCQTTYALSKGMVKYLATKPYRRFYLINQDFASGRDTSARFKENLKASIPDAVIVGEDFHPFNLKDFGPYITKIMAAKPDIIFTSNFGTDLTNLISQARAFGLKAPFPFAATFIADPYPLNELKDDAVGIYYAHMYSLRVKTPENENMIARFHGQHKTDKDFLTWWPFGNIGQVILGMQMAFAAIEKAGSLDPEKIIQTFEGFEYKTPVGLWSMRACDHQLIMPMFGGTIEGGPNPFFNGSIRSDVKFPWEGPNLVTIRANEVTIPATPSYNPRCK